MRKKLSLIVSLVMVLSLLFPGSLGALAEGGQQADSAETAANTGSETTADAPAPAAGLATPTDLTYDYNAELYLPETGDFPGVYETALQPNNASKEQAPTIGMPSIADANLDKPTLESPAIIQGAAVGYEIKTGPTEYETLKERPEPYSDYKVSILEETAPDGSVHRKLSGFDGTYVLTRLDVSAFFDPNASTPQYLHMKQQQNRALIPGMGMNDNNKAFTDMTGNKNGAYLLSDLVDKNGATPYIDILLFSTASIAAGADAGKENVPNGDVPLELYVDDVGDYNPDLVYDPQSTDPDHAAKVLAKFFDDAKALLNSVSRYLIKGSDLALETAVENGGGENKDTGTTYWSLKKSFEDPYYDLPENASPDDPGCGRTVKLISEVAVTNELRLEGTDENHLKKRTLDVNSFDVQIANNTTSGESVYSDGFVMKNAWLTLADKSNTTGAEMAIGNNARFVIDQGGKLIIDETCQLEIEWDGATTTPEAGGSTPAKKDILNNGLLELRAGGEIINNGILTIEGFEGKPVQPGAEQAADAPKGCGEMTISEGATFTNNGSLMVYGKLYNLGTLINNGKYDDLIISNDPDKGQFAYHKGIIVSWKDDVTQSGVEPGSLINGKDRDGKIYSGAKLINNGDIVLVPGLLDNSVSLQNSEAGRIYLAAVTDAIIPVEPPAGSPATTPVSKRITLNPPVPSVFVNYGTIVNSGRIAPASVVVRDDAGLGDLTEPGKLPHYFAIRNYGSILNWNYIYGMGDDGNLLVRVDLADGSVLKLFYDSTFELILASGTKLSGTFSFRDDEALKAKNMLVFDLNPGTVVRVGQEDTSVLEPKVLENGDFEYEFAVSAENVKFTLAQEFTARAKNLLEEKNAKSVTAEIR